jgi:hypothetical protein
MLASKVIAPARQYKLDVHIVVHSCSYQFPLQTEILDQGRILYACSCLKPFFPWYHLSASRHTKTGCLDPSCAVCSDLIVNRLVHIFASIRYLDFICIMVFLVICKCYFDIWQERPSLPSETREHNYSWCSNVSKVHKLWT